MKTLFASTLVTIALVLCANGTNTMLSEGFTQGIVPFVLGALLIIPGVIHLRPKPRYR